MKNYFAYLLAVATLLLAWQLPVNSSLYPEPKGADQAIKAWTSQSKSQGLLERAWMEHLYKANNAKAIRYARKVLSKEAGNYAAHELLLNIYQMRGDYAAGFTHLLAMLEQDRVENCIYLPGVIYSKSNRDALWLSSQQQEQLETVLTRKIADPQVPALQKYYQSRLLSALYLETGRLDKVREIADQLGFIREWLVIGPFENQEKLGFDEVYAPEEEINLNKTYKGMRGMVKWQKLSAVRNNGIVDLNSVFYPQEWTAGYALTYVYSPEDRIAAIRTGSDDSLKIWFNEDLVLNDETYKGYQAEQHVMGIKLRCGWNKILVKVCQGGGAWEFGLRLTDPAGVLLTDLKYTLDPKLYTGLKQVSGQKGVEVVGIARQLLERLAKTPQDESSLYYLARNYKNEDQREEAIRAYERLLKQNPAGARYWLEAGEVYFLGGRPTQGLAAYQKAVEIDPDYCEARICLAKYYYEKKMHKKSEVELKRVLKNKPAQVEAILWTGQNHEVQAQWEEAYRQGQSALQQRPELSWALNAAGYWAAQRGFQEEALGYYQKALKKQFAFSPTYYNLAHIYRNQGQYEKVVRTYQALLKIQDLNLDLYMQIAATYRQWKKYEKAIQTCKQVLELCPTHARAFELLGRINFDEGNQAQARTNLEKSLQYQPNNMLLREYIKKIFPFQDKIFEQYGRSEKTCEKIRQRKVVPEQFPKCAAAHLLNQVVTHVFADGSYSEMRHVLVKILTDSGRDAFGSAYLPNDPSVKILKAYTLKADGKKVEPTDIRGGKIVFAAVEPGAIMEYQYTYDAYYGGWLQGYYYSQLPFQARDTPMLNSEWVVALPQNQKLNTYINGKIAHHTKTRADEQVHIWRAKNMEPIYSEPFQPAYQDLAAGVFISTIPSWEFMAKWAANLVKDQMELDEALKTKLAVLTTNQPTLQDKIRSIYNFVAQDIRYESRGDTWIFGVKPQKAANIYADGYGVCKDKALLLIALLRAIDVPAHFALVETNNLGHLVKDLPFSWFNHAIVCLLPDKEKPLFLDPTFNYTAYGDMWDYTQDNDAFVIQENGYEFIRTPVLPMPEQNSRDNIIILPEGQIQVTGSLEIKGYIAAWLRHEFSIPGKRKELLEKQINQELSGAKVEKCEVKDWENINLPLGIDYQFNVPAFAHLSENKMRFKVLGGHKPGEIYTEKSERLYDLILEFSVNNTEQQTYHWPANYQVDTLPGNLVIDTKWFKYERTWIKQKNALQCSRALEFKVKRVKKDEYTKFREACTRVDAAEKEQVVLSLKP